MNPSMQEAIKRRIQRLKKKEDVFTTTDFLNLGTRNAVDKALSRLAEEGFLRRIVPGLYDLPRKSSYSGKLLPPSPNALARAVGRKNNSRVMISGAQAANQLGLSEQVPAQYVFLIDGRSRTISLGNWKLRFKRTSPNVMKTSGRVTEEVVQALRYLGKDNIDEENTISVLSRNLSLKAIQELKSDMPLIPAWMQPIIQQVIQRKKEYA